MSRIDLIALQQRLAQHPPTPVPAEPPSWSTRPAPASALRTTPVPKARPAAASAAASGTLHATTAMRAARFEERARADALRAQIDELNAALVVARAEAERALAQEHVRADRLSDRVDAVQRDLDAARADAVVAERRAEAERDAERARADALRERIEGLQGQLTARQEVIDAAEATRRAREDERRARGLVARLRAAWRGE
jgi:hypothetical protein